MSPKKTWALCLHTKDNVATVLNDVHAGESLVVRDKSGQTVEAFEVVESIPRGHKTAVMDIPARTEVMKYGEIIGRSVTEISKGVACCRQLIGGMPQDADRISVPCSRLVVGLECGGSDFTSGMAANPAVGIVADRFVDMGANVVFGETAEALGAEHILVQRAVNNKVKKATFLRKCFVFGI